MMRSKDMDEMLLALPLYFNHITSYQHGSPTNLAKSTRNPVNAHGIRNININPQAYNLRRKDTAT